MSLSCHQIEQELSECKEQLEALAEKHCCLNLTYAVGQLVFTLDQLDAYFNERLKLTAIPIGTIDCNYRVTPDLEFNKDLTVGTILYKLPESIKE